ncbi:MAG: hypothetical protein WAW20_17255, partial [Anaerolineae bacterium]
VVNLAHNEKYRPALAGTFRRSLEEEGAFVTSPASRLTLVSLVQPCAKYRAVSLEKHERSLKIGKEDAQLDRRAARHM